MHRFGYQTADYYTYVISQYAQANIPLETFVADSQYMDRDQIWTLGSNFSVSEVRVRLPCCQRAGMLFGKHAGCPRGVALSDISRSRMLCLTAYGTARPAVCSSGVLVDSMSQTRIYRGGVL